MKRTHGKRFVFVGFEEAHSTRGHDWFEALARARTRRDVLTWITSYAGIRHAPGIPLYDLMQAGKRGDDRRMFFSWYGGDFPTHAAPAAGQKAPAGWGLLRGSLWHVPNLLAGGRPGGTV